MRMLTHFATLAERTRTAFNEHYVKPEGTIHSDAETLYALAIVFGCSIPKMSSSRASGSPSSSPKSGYHIQTGFAGTPFITHALTQTGHLGDAYRLLLQTRVPILALSRHDGGDNDLGALGLDVARRHHQPGPDDELQSLRLRRGGLTGCIGLSVASPHSSLVTPGC